MYKKTCLQKWHIYNCTVNINIKSVLWCTVDILGHSTLHFVCATCETVPCGNKTQSNITHWTVNWCLFVAECAEPSADTACIPLSHILSPCEIMQLVGGCWVWGCSDTWGGWLGCWCRSLVRKLLNKGLTELFLHHWPSLTLLVQVLVDAEEDRWHFWRPPSAGEGVGVSLSHFEAPNPRHCLQTVTYKTQCNAQMLPNIMKKYINAIQWGVIYIGNK